MNFKKLLLVSITLLLGVMSGGVMASSPSSVTYLGGNEYAYYDGSSTTNYFLGFTVANYSSDSTPFNTANMVWWGNSGVASLFANAAAGASLGSDPSINYGHNPGFAYSGSYTSPSNWSLSMFDSQGSTVVNSFTIGPPTYSSWTVATSSLTAGAPEIDGSLAPKVGFLLGCLFLMFGRKKQNTESMLTA